MSKIVTVNDGGSSHWGNGNEHYKSGPKIAGKMLTSRNGHSLENLPRTIGGKMESGKNTEDDEGHLKL